MASASESHEIDFERHLLSDHTQNDGANGDETIIYKASFQEMEDNYVKYQTALWVLTSLSLILACGIGLVMLLYLPIRRYVVRKNFQSRELYVTPSAIVYKVRKPLFIPFLGVLNREKHVVLPSVADVIVEQGFLQSFFGIYSIRIENMGVRRPASDDVQIQGIVSPNIFRKAILTHLSTTRNESFVRQASVSEDCATSGVGRFYSPHAWERRTGTGFMSQMISPPSSLLHDYPNPSGEQILNKLDQLGSSVKRIQYFLEQRP